MRNETSSKTLLKGSWTRGSVKVPSNPNHSMILWTFSLPVSSSFWVLLPYLFWGSLWSHCVGSSIKPFVRFTTLDTRLKLLVFVRWEDDMDKFRRETEVQTNWVACSDFRCKQVKWLKVWPGSHDSHSRDWEIVSTAESSGSLLGKDIVVSVNVCS